MQELNRMHRQTSRLFGTNREPVTEYRAVNLWVNDREAVLTVALPGVDPQSLNLSVAGETVTIEGERKPAEDVPENAFIRRERHTGRFTRSVDLPYEVEADRVTARYERGVLHVTLPRKESTKPRRIAVSAS
jgi:HSP20 family protein